MKMWLSKKTHNPARRGVGNKILYFFAFVTVKQNKKILTEWSCAITLPCNIGSKVEFQNLLSQRMATNSKGSMNYSCLIFSLPAISNNLIFFFCTDPCAAVCVKGSHRANNGKQRTRLPGDLPFIKTSSHKGHIRLKLVIIIIRLKSGK